MNEVVVYIDPFEEFQKERKAAENSERETQQRRQEGKDDDNRTTWTGKRVRADGTVENDSVGVGKYLKAKLESQPKTSRPEQVEEDEIIEFVDEPDPGPVKKKVKGGGGFGNFDGW